jgi:hypothetical protein
VSRITVRITADLTPDERFRLDTFSDYGLQPVTIDVQSVTLTPTAAKVQGTRVRKDGTPGHALVQGTEVITPAFLDLLPEDLLAVYNNLV